MPRQRTSFQKRQKELARQDKQRKKVERRAERKLLKVQRAANPDLAPTDVEAPDQAAAEDAPALPS